MTTVGEPRAQSAVSGLISRILVAVVGLPVVLGAVWVGGWWLFTLVAVAAVVAVHEYVTMARPLRPLAPAVYVGAVLALVGAEKGDPLHGPSVGT